MTATVSFTTDGVLWMKVLKGLAASLDEGNMHFIPNEIDLIDSANPDNAEFVENYTRELEEQTSSSIFERASNFPGVHMMALTNSHASMTALSLPPCFFKKYFASKNVVVGLNFSDKDQGIVALLKPQLKENCEVCVEVFYDVTSPYILHTIRNKNSKGVIQIKCSVMDIDETPLNMEYHYCGRAIMGAQKFHKHIKSLKSYAAPITIGFNQNPIDGKKNIKIQCIGMIASAEATFEVEEDDGGTGVRGEEDQQKTGYESGSTLKVENPPEVKDEPDNIFEDFTDIFGGKDDNNIDYYMNEAQCDEIYEEEEEDWGIGTFVPESSSSKRKKVEEEYQKKKKKKKAERANAFCHKLTTTTESCEDKISQKFIMTATTPIGPLLNYYWGDKNEGSMMPVVIEHRFGVGGLLAHYICPQVSDEDYEDATKDI